MPLTTRGVMNILVGTTVAIMTSVGMSQLIKLNTIFNINSAQRAMGLVPDENGTLCTTVKELLNFINYEQESLESSATLRMAAMLTFLIVGITISVTWNCADNSCTPKNSNETKKESKNLSDKSPAATAPHSAHYKKAEKDLDSTPVQQKIIDNVNKTTPLINASLST